MKTKHTIKTGEYNPNYPISKIVINKKVNRDIVESHIQRMQNKLLKHFWMLPLIITKKGNKLLEGNHRYYAAKGLGLKTVPVYIVDWIDVDKIENFLDSIISLNSGNLNWSNLNYLKQFSLINKDYKYVYNLYKIHKDTISIGTMVNLFFNPSKIKDDFKNGKAHIKNKSLSEYLLNQFISLVQEYGKTLIQTYQIRAFLRLSHTICKKENDFVTIEYLLKKYREMARTKHPTLTDTVHFRRTINMYYNDYKINKKLKTK